MYGNTYTIKIIGNYSDPIYKYDLKYYNQLLLNNRKFVWYQRISNNKYLINNLI